MWLSATKSKESCMRHNVIRNLQSIDAQCIPDLQANQDDADHLFCGLMQPIIAAFGQPCPVCNDSFSYWSFGTQQLNQRIVLDSEIMTVPFTACLRVNVPFSQVYSDLLHSGF